MDGKQIFLGNYYYSYTILALFIVSESILFRCSYELNEYENRHCFH
ncbi:MAG: hypothetical protein ACD_78C00012G0001, partial [uncultured bacterium (gcode 4)]